MRATRARRSRAGGGGGGGGGGGVQLQDEGALAAPEAGVVLRQSAPAQGLGMCGGRSRIDVQQARRRRRRSRHQGLQSCIAVLRSDDAQLHGIDAADWARDMAGATGRGGQGGAPGDNDLSRFPGGPSRCTFGWACCCCVPRRRGAASLWHQSTHHPRTRCHACSPDTNRMRPPP